MDDIRIGSYIARCRKEAGITQEELGRSVGVSTQAVSRWECGGTPDVALLPAIADRLGVTVDTLFGRERGTPYDMRKILSDWIGVLPPEKRLSELCRLVWYGCRNLVSRLDLKAPDQYLDNCEFTAEMGDEEALLKTMVQVEEGIALGIGAEDMAFMALFPEPEKGYEHFLEPDEAYQQLFAALALPGAITLLRYFYSRKNCYYTAAALAGALALSSEQVEQALDAMEKVHLLSRQTIVLDTGEVPVWMVHDQGAVVPFLYLARILAEKGDGFHMCWQTRKRPLFTWENRDNKEKQE